MIAHPANCIAPLFAYYFQQYRRQRSGHDFGATYDWTYEWTNKRIDGLCDLLVRCTVCVLACIRQIRILVLITCGCVCISCLFRFASQNNTHTCSLLNHYEHAHTHSHTEAIESHTQTQTHDTRKFNPFNSLTCWLAPRTKDDDEKKYNVYKIDTHTYIRIRRNLFVNTPKAQTRLGRV